MPRQHHAGRYMLRSLRRYYVDEGLRKMSSYILALAAICSYLCSAYYCWAVFNNPGWVLRVMEIAVRGREYGEVEDQSIARVIWCRMLVAMVVIGFMASAASPIYFSMVKISYELACLFAGTAALSAVWLADKLGSVASSRTP